MFDDVCPIFVPLTLSSNFSYVLASCAAHAARASSRALLLLSLFIRLLRRFTPYQPIFLQSAPFHFTLTLPLPSSTQLDLHFILQLRAPRMSALFLPLSFFSPFLLLLILFSVYPLVHISPLLFSHFSSLRPRYLPVRTLLDRRVLYRQCPPAVTCTWLFHTHVPVSTQIEQIISR